MIILEFYPADVEMAKKGVLVPHKKDKPFIVECDECDVKKVIKKQITSFNSYVVNCYLGKTRLGVKYEGYPYYSINGKFYHPLSASNPSLESVCDKVLSLCGFYNSINKMSKNMVNMAREKPILKAVLWKN